MSDQAHTVSRPDMHDPDIHTGHDAVGSILEGSARPDTYASSPSVVSWFSNDGDFSPRSSRYFSELFALYEPDIIEAQPEYYAQALTHDARKASIITVFPGCSKSALEKYNADVTQHKPLQDKSNPTDGRCFFKNFKKHYERAKEVCRDGPPGETDLFWAGVKNYLEARKKAGVITEIHTRKPTNYASLAESRKPGVEQQATDRTLRPPPTMVNPCIDVNRPKKRQDSAVSYGDVSRTSREVPLKLHRTVLDVDINKPLPPSPPLSAVPKPHRQMAKGRGLDVNKPLPRTPLPCFSQGPHPSCESAGESPVDPPWPIHQAQPVGPTSFDHQVKVLQQNNLPHDGCSKQVSTQSQPLVKKPSCTGESKPSKADKAHNALKAKISRPILIPSTVDYSPSCLAPHPDIVGEKAKGKQKGALSPNWRDKLAHPTMPMGHKGKKRPNSDESFGCQGVSDAAVYMGDGGPSVQDEGPRMRGEDLTPVPLFTGTDTGGIGGSHQSDCEFKDTEFRRTGRWI